MSARIGDRVLVIVAPDGAVTESRCDDTTWALDLCLAAAPGKRPFTHIMVKVCRNGGPWPDWRTEADIETRPDPGWAADGAEWCRVCGSVAFDGAALPCGHGAS